MAAMGPYAWAHELLQAIPGIDEVLDGLVVCGLTKKLGSCGRASANVPAVVAPLEREVSGSTFCACLAAATAETLRPRMMIG